jgi:Replication-relaxation
MVTNGGVAMLLRGCLSFRVAGSARHNPSRHIFFGNERKEKWGYRVRRATPARPYVSARGLKQTRERLSERDLGVIRQVAELRLMSARQIQALHFPDVEHDNEQAATRARQRVLERLTRERLLIRLERRIGGVRAGSAGFVLALGPVGQRVLAIDGPRRRSYEPTLRFVDHTLAVAQLIVDVTVASRRGLLDLVDVQPEPRCWREFSDMGGRRLLRPDAYVALGSGEYELRWFIEVDRASESLPVIVRKCRLYADYYQSGKEQAAQGGVFPRVCWIVPDGSRAERLRRTITQDRTLPEGLFVVTTSEQAVAVLSHTTQVTVNT